MAAAPPAAAASQEVQQAIRAYISGAFETPQPPPQISSALASRTLPLLALVRALGPDLTADDEEQRSRAVELLSNVVLHHAHDAVLFDRQATLTLATFFASKLEDGSTTAAVIARSRNAATAPLPGSAPRYRFQGIPEGSEMLAAALRALDRLARLDRFGNESATQALEALIAHVVPRDHPQALRFLCYALLDTLLARHRNAAKAMGERFLKGYVSLVEGEKDPRNLIYILAMDRVLLLEWDMGPELVEQFFDITYCYFPITFRPPPDDPYGITTEDLKLSLLRCLVANPLLAPHAMPLLTEKLQAAGGKAKRDALEVLEHGLPVFGRAAAEANAKQLWDILKLEIMNATDDETSICAQRCLESLLRVLYSGTRGTPEGVAQEIVADCLEVLEEPEKSLAKPAASTMACLVAACAETAYLGVRGVLEQMLTYFKDPDDVSVRAPILGHVATVLRTCKEVYLGVPPPRSSSSLEQAVQQQREQRAKGDAAGPGTTPWKLGPAARDAPAPEGPQSEAVVAPATSGIHSDDDATSSSTRTGVRAQNRTYDGDVRPLDAFRDELLSCLSNGIRSATCRATALEASVHLVQIPSLLSKAEVHFVAEGINGLLLLPDADDVRPAAMRGLRELAEASPRVLEETTLPMLFSKLPDRIRVGVAANGEEMTTRAMSVDGGDVTTEGEHDVGGAAGMAEAEDAEALRRTQDEVRRALVALAAICSPPALFESLVVKLLTKLDLCCSVKAYAAEPPGGGAGRGQGGERRRREARERELNLGYARGLLNTLSRVVEDKAARRDRDLARHATSVPARLVSLGLCAALHDDDDDDDDDDAEADQSAGAARPARVGRWPIFAEPSVIRDAGCLNLLLAQQLDASRQRHDVARWLYPAFERGELERLARQTGSALRLPGGPAASGAAGGTASASHRPPSTVFDPLGLVRGGAGTTEEGEAEVTPKFASARTRQRNAVFLLSTLAVTFRTGGGGGGAGGRVKSGGDGGGGGDDDDEGGKAAAAELPCGGDVVKWLSTLLAFAASAENALQHEAACALFASTVNKHVLLSTSSSSPLASSSGKVGASVSTDDEVKALLDDFWRREVVLAPTSAVAAPSAADQPPAARSASGQERRRRRRRRRRNAVRAWFWVVKALTVRASALGDELLERALAYLFAEAGNARATAPIAAAAAAAKQGEEGRDEEEGEEEEEDRAMLSAEAAQGLALVASADDGVLCKENGAVIRMFYRQRFFAKVIPRLLAGYRAAVQASQPSSASSPTSTAAAEAVQTSYLVTISYLLASMPKPTVRERLAELWPLVLRAMQLERRRRRREPRRSSVAGSAEEAQQADVGGAVANAVATVTMAAAVGKKLRAEEAGRSSVSSTTTAKATGGVGGSADGKKSRAPLDLVEEHLSSIIERLLVLVKPEAGNTPTVRAAALRCLATLARTVDYVRLQPHASRVRRALGERGVGIDDARRAVRVQGVEARDAWLALRPEK